MSALNDWVQRAVEGYGPGWRVGARVGDGHRIWEADYDGNPVILKSFPAGEAHLAALEAAALEHLAGGDGYVVPTLVRAASGEGVVACADFVVIATRALRGAKLEWTDFTLMQWHALGAILASLHARLATFAPARALESKRAIVCGRDLEHERETIARQRTYHYFQNPRTQAYFDQRVALLEHGFARAQTPPEGLVEQPVHNDYNQHNYLFDASFAPSPAILDWEGMILAPPAFEVVRCLNVVPLERPAYARAFLKGYRAVRSVDLDAVRWAVSACFVEHAVKHWPVEAIILGEMWHRPHFVGHFDIVKALYEGRDALARFYSVTLAEP